MVSFLSSHGARYGRNERRLMGPESLTSNWGRNCIDCALLWQQGKMTTVCWRVFLLVVEDKQEGRGQTKREGERLCLLLCESTVSNQITENQSPCLKQN